METVKMTWAVFNSLGFGTYTLAFIINLGDIKSAILFLGAVVYGCYRLYDKHLDSQKKNLILTNTGEI